jgi:uncharacterized protein DUF6029
MSRRAAASIAAALVLGSAPARAQFTFSNLLEPRVGKDPDDPRPNVPDNRLTLYEQFNLDYFHDALQLGLRYETFLPSEERGLEYRELSRRYAAWSSRWLDARVGNYEALFGRGVVLRAFELPGVVREELWRQFGDSRDLDGARVRLHHGGAELLVLGGKPRRADAPPDAARLGLVTGALGTGEVAPGIRPGGEYVRIDTQSEDLFANPGTTSEVSGGFVQVGLDPWLARLGVQKLSLDSYVELARATGMPPSPVGSPKVEPGRGEALYLMQNVALGDLLPGLRAGASWEYKDYQNFDLPTAINEPPTLVREHAYALLNRNTHVLEPMQEEGYQFEPRLDYRGWTDLTLNWSRAENRDSHRFEERYAELGAHVRGATASLFADDAQDGAAGLFDRETVGVHALLPVHGPHSLEIEYEQMTAVRASSLGDQDFKDNYVALTYAWADVVSVAAVRQTTDDPVDAGPPDPVTGSIPRRVFPSLSARVRIGDHHELVGFWGRRRGGIACTAGTCYLLPAFDGLSFRLTSRF